MDDTRTQGSIVDDTLNGDGIIPFADEAGARTGHEVEPAASGRDELDAALDVSLDSDFDLGERVSVVDRELGLEDLGVPAREGRYECPCCGMGATRVVRVRVVSHRGWAAVCAVCAASLLEKLPGTIVGGAVKPSRKRRIGRIRATGDRATENRGANDKKGRGGGQTPHGFRGGPAGGLRQAG